MNYSELLDAYIKKSGLSLAEIARRMNDEKGIKIDRSYISKLRNHPKYPAAEDVNRALAEITGGDPDALVMAGYYQTAPIEVKRSLDKLNISEFIKDYVAREKPISYSYEGPSEFYVKEEAEEMGEYLNSGAFFSTLGKSELDDTISQILKHMEENNPSQYQMLIKELTEKCDSASTKHLLRDATASSLFLPHEPDKMTNIPILGSIRAGQPIDRIEDNDGYTLVDPDIMRGREGFALKVKGDSMSGDRIQDGDLVVVVKQEEVQPHEIAVVAVNDQEATLKRVKIQNNMCMLIPSNPTLQPDLVPSKDVRILGKVVQLIINMN